MAKKASKKSSKKTTKKRSTKKKSASKTAPAPQTPRYETKDEHLVLSHLMYILFLFAAGFAAVFTVQFLMEKATTPDYYGVAALVFLGWAFVFKIFAHRVHPPHH